MLAKEFIIETIIHKSQIGNIVVHVDDHYLIRARQRNVSHKETGLIITKFPKIESELQNIEPGQQYWVFDTILDISLGMRKKMDQNNIMQLLLKTVVRGSPHLAGALPIITI